MTAKRRSKLHPRSSDPARAKPASSPAENAASQASSPAKSAGAAGRSRAKSALASSSNKTLAPVEIASRPSEARQADASPKISREPRPGLRSGRSKSATRSSAASAAAEAALSFGDPAAVVVPARSADNPASPSAAGSPAIPPEPPRGAPAPAQKDDAGEVARLDLDRLARNMGAFVEESGRAASALLKRPAAGGALPSLATDVSDLFKTLGQVAGHWLADPARAIQAQSRISGRFIDLWSESLQRMTGAAPPRAAEPAPNDKRFSAPEWREIPVFDFLRQSYLMTTDWASSLVDEADTLDPQTRDKARFYLRQVSSALSPSNFLATNPELLKNTLTESGENLVRGMRMLAEDIEAGEGELRIRQSDRSPFELGVNMAVTPGKVVYRNDLMELIQYAPATREAFRRPLLIVPPWINKFYVLDLNPEKSFIRWAVEQGLTVFVVSWVNPDQRHADKGFEAYMREGVFAALDAVEQATGERDTAAIGYCVGGTLLAIALAHMAARGDDRISSATFFTAQVDFRDAGDLKVFADENQIETLEAEMAGKGYLEGTRMANAFNMLRPDELIWSFVVNNYMKGKAPSAFDLLTWNSDSTRMPAANHAFYLRNCYLENRLTKGQMVIGGETLDLGKVRIPVYNLATREDHIAPARSVFTGAKFFGGAMRYVLAGSGHIAGVVNPPARGKYQYWAGAPVEGTFEDWLKKASKQPGSWWPDWLAWLAEQAPEKVAARVPGAGKLPALCDAPGEYVRVQA